MLDNFVYTVRIKNVFYKAFSRELSAPSTYSIDLLVPLESTTKFGCTVTARVGSAEKFKRNVR